MDEGPLGGVWIQHNQATNNKMGYVNPFQTITQCQYEKPNIYLLLTSVDMYNELTNGNHSHVLTLFTNMWFNYMTRIC